MRRLDRILILIMLWNIHFSNVRHAKQWYRWPGKTISIGAQVAVGYTYILLIIYSSSCNGWQLTLGHHSDGPVR